MSRLHMSKHVKKLNSECYEYDNNFHFRYLLHLVQKLNPTLLFNMHFVTAFSNDQTPAWHTSHTYILARFSDVLFELVLTDKLVDTTLCLTTAKAANDMIATAFKIYTQYTDLRRYISNISLTHIPSR